MNLVIKIIVLFLFFNVSASAQNNDFFKKEVEPKMKRGKTKAKIIVWSDKRTYKIGEKIKIVVEWNKGDLIDQEYFIGIKKIKLLRTSHNQSYVAGEILYNKVYTFIANKTGKIILPRFEIEYNFITYESCKLKLRIK